MVVGVTNETGNFFPAMSVLTTHEEEIYGGYIHSLNIHPSFRMADGAEAITLAGENIFGNCQDCQKSSRFDVFESCPLSLHTKVETCRSC